MAEITTTTDGTTVETATRTPTFFVGMTPLAAAPGYLDLWQREIDVARQFAEAWTATLGWMGAVYAAARWPGPGGRSAGAEADLEVDQTGPVDVAATVTVTTASEVTGEAFDEVVHLLVDDDLSATVLQRIGP